MSNTSADIQIQVNWNNYSVLISIVILFYDFILTFRDEVELYWQRPSKTFVSMLFYINRYLALLGNVPLLVFRFWPQILPLAGCTGMTIYSQFFLSLVQLVISILFVVRVHAVYQKSKIILGVLIVAVIAMVGNGLLQWFLTKGSTGGQLPQNISVSVGCLQSYSPDQGLHYVYLWLGVVLVDLLVFVLTLKKTVELKRAYKRTSLWEVVMRDGVLYFAVITFINAANIVVFAFGQNYMKPLLSNLANIIASVMMGRLMLNLRRISQDLDITHITVESMALPLSCRPDLSGTETYTQTYLETTSTDPYIVRRQAS